jgi:small conductance mechanosensitive channel
MALLNTKGRLVALATSSVLALGAEKSSVLASSTDSTETTEEVINQITAITGTEEIDPNVITKFLQDLPDMAFNLGLKVVMAIVLFFVAWQIINYIGKIFNKSLIKMSLGKIDKSLADFLTSLIKVVLRIMLIFAIIAAFGVDTASIIAVLGSAGVAVGLAVQGALSNFAGGVLILISKPFEVGDYIVDSTTKYEGTVTEISLINTKLATMDNRVVIIPNGGLADSAIINNTFQDERILDVKVGVSYESDLKLVKKVLKKTVEKSSFALKNKDKLVFIDELADSGIIVGIRCYVPAKSYLSAKWEMNELIKEDLDAASISIPYPQLDVHMK